MLHRCFGSCRGLTLTVAVGAVFACGRSASASTVWDGPTVIFTKIGGADPTLPSSQDRLTPNVWITRGEIQGLYNARTESGFVHFVSPADTRWANGLLANYDSLIYTDWNSWALGVNPGPPSTVGVDAVVHLISDDIYLSIKFISWGGPGSGGGFSYERSTVPAPASLALLGLGGLVMTRRRRG